LYRSTVHIFSLNNFHKRPTSWKLHNSPLTVEVECNNLQVGEEARTLVEVECNNLQVGEEARTLVGEEARTLGLRSRKGPSMERVLALALVGEELELELELDPVTSLERVPVIHTLLQILDTKRSQNIDPRLYLLGVRGNK
jgi:hypothetical protein